MKAWTNNRITWVLCAVLAGDGVVLALAGLKGGIRPGQDVWLVLGGFEVAAWWNTGAPRCDWLTFNRAMVSSAIGEDLVETGQLIRLGCLWVTIEYPNTSSAERE